MQPASKNNVVLSPAHDAASIGLRAAGVVGFALATALAAQVRIYVLGTPVPITLQTLPVLLAGVTLGPWLGTASMLFYLLLGATGYHVFALDSAESLREWGLAYFVGPTAGYLVGFVLAQPVLGLLTRNGSRTHARSTWLRLLAALLAGDVLIFAPGLLWLHLWAGHESLVATLTGGLVPFLPGLALKTAAAFALATAVAPRLRGKFD